MTQKKYKYHYKQLEDRSWGSLEADGQAQRKANIKATQKASAMLADNAFADNVPDDLDKYGSVNIEPTHVATVNILESN